MAPNSNTSSMQPQNGSIYQAEGAFQTTYIGNTCTSAATATQARRFPGGQRPVQNHRTHQNDRGAGSQTSASHDNTAYEQPTSSYNADQDYYLPTGQVFYPAETTTYPNELTFEMDSNGATLSVSEFQSQNSYQNTNHAYQQMTAQHHSIPTSHNRHHSATIEIWSAEQYSDERLRLGLPRYEDGQQPQEYRQSAHGSANPGR